MVIFNNHNQSFGHCKLQFVMWEHESRICYFIILQEKPFCVLIYLFIFIYLFFAYFDFRLEKSFELCILTLLILQINKKLNFAQNVRTLRPSCTHMTTWHFFHSLSLDFGTMTQSEQVRKNSVMCKLLMLHFFNHTMIGLKMSISCY